MRVISWTPCYPPDVGGIETLCSVLHPIMAERGVDVTVLSGPGPLTTEGVERVDGIEVHRLPLRTIVESAQPGPVLRAQREIAAVRRAIMPDLVHLHLSGPEVLFHFLTDRESPAPLLVTLHNSPSSLGHGVADGLYRRALEEASWVTAVSAVAMDEARALVPELADRSNVISNGVLIRPAPSPTERHSAHFGLVGRLIDQKQPHIAIQAIGIMRDQGTEARLTVIGDGNLRPGLERLTADLGLEHAVTFTGAVSRPQVGSLLRHFTAMVMPSAWEGMPMAALEAGAAATAVIATPVGGLAELIDDGVSGRIVVDATPEAFAQAMTQVVEDPTVALKWGNAAYEVIRRCYSMEHCVDNYLELYEKVAWQT